MRYLIFVPSTKSAFFSEWFDANNGYCEGDVVFDLKAQVFTMDGVNWQPIPVDAL